MEFVGRKVKIELINSSQYEGFVHSVDPVFGKLSLEKVVCTDEDGEKTKLHGLQNIFGHEIASIVATEEVIKPRSKEETNTGSRKNGDRCIMKPKIGNPHLERLGTLNPKLLTLKNSKADDGMTSSGNEEGSSGTEQEDVISHPDYTIISKLNSVFYDAKFVWVKKLTGLLPQGVMLPGKVLEEKDRRLLVLVIMLKKVGSEEDNSVDGARSEEPNIDFAKDFDDALASTYQQVPSDWCSHGGCVNGEKWKVMLGSAVPGHVIVFDILRLGKAAFDDGLKDILEAETILKVFHDCRMVSDIMYHQYDISLVNVFDTQVASAFVYRLRHHNDWPRHVDGLASCLIDHLDLSADQVNWAVIRDGFRETDEEVWLQRPVKRNTIAALVKNVIHLLDLRQVLTDKMMEEYVAGVNIYLSQVRDASTGDTERYQRMSYLLPTAFQDIKRFMSSYHRLRQKDDLRDVNGFRENFAPIRQPNVIFSRDSLWHVGSKNTNSTQKDNALTEPKKLARYAAQASQLMSQVRSEQQTADSQSEGQLETGTSQTQDKSMKSTCSTGRNSGKRLIDQIKMKMSEQQHEMDEAEHFKAPGDDIDYVSETTDLLNWERDMRSHSMLTSQRYTQSHNMLTSQGYNSDTQSYHQSSHSVQEILCQDREPQATQELSAGSMMRALINQQAPPGSEENPELDSMTLLPAGKVIPSAASKKKSPPLPHQGNTVRSTDSNFARRLIEKEMEISERLKCKSRPVSTQQSFEVPYDNRLSDTSASSYLQTENGTQKYEKQTFFPWQSINESKMSHAFAQSNSDNSTKHQFVIPKVPSSSEVVQISNNRTSNKSSSSEDESAITSTTKVTSPLSSRLQALMNAMKT